MANSIHYVAQAGAEFTGPAWNNSNEYPSLESNEFTYDQQQLESLIGRLEESLVVATPLMALPTPIPSERQTLVQTLVLTLQAICEIEEQAWTLLSNMRTYASCLVCIDSSNTEAAAVLSQMVALSGRLEAIVTPVSIFLTHAPEEILNPYFSRAHVKPYEFLVRRRREMADTVLSDVEESLLARLKANGPMAFGALYDQLSGSIRCNYIDPETNESKLIGLAQASGLIRNSDPAKRQAAWRAIQNGWKTQATSAAAILNGIGGWRLEVTAQRSKARQAKGGASLTILDLALHDSRIKRETLEAMMSAVTAKKEIGRRAMRAMAKAMGKEKLDPWDLLAPAPVSALALGAQKNQEPLFTFEKGMGLIRDAFEAIDPTFSDFVDTMKKNRWIEGRSLPNKRPGAFCTHFQKSNSPRVYQTFMGSLDDVRTLAHELGHAYHSWILKDLPQPLTDYPMTIAETASIFAETVFSNSLLTKAKSLSDPFSALQVAWQNAETATSYLLNIPARFDFEKSFYELRKSGAVGVDQLNDLMTAAWEKWYGSTLTEVEKQFWMTKLHFSIPNTSFYNFPYTFGALFSLGIFALREERGASFWPSYTALLRETGRMTAEDLAMKHLGVDLSNEEFWLKSLRILDSQVSELEALIRSS